MEGGPRSLASSISLPLGSWPCPTAICLPGVVWGLWGRSIKTAPQVKLPNWNDYASCNLTPISGAGTMLSPKRLSGLRHAASLEIRPWPAAVTAWLQPSQAHGAGT